ncbi:hypothetical protein ACHAP5_010415 [Fusarium lateritium]
MDRSKFTLGVPFDQIPRRGAPLDSHLDSPRSRINTPSTQATTRDGIPETPNTPTQGQHVATADTPSSQPVPASEPATNNGKPPIRTCQPRQSKADMPSYKNDWPEEDVDALRITPKPKPPRRSRRNVKGDKPDYGESFILRECPWLMCLADDWPEDTVEALLVSEDEGKSKKDNGKKGGGGGTGKGGKK